MLTESRASERYLFEISSGMEMPNIKKYEEE